MPSPRPRLLGVDRSVPLIVMTDLGDAPSLADLLLGESADAARAALLSWALGCGQLAACTAGQQAELALLRAALPGGDRPLGDTHWLADRILSTAGLLGDRDITLPAGLADDLAAVAGIVAPGSYEVFSPGDICPDNNLLTSSGLRFIDYESAEFHSVYLDAAYLRMPFSTCWCVSGCPAISPRQPRLPTGGRCAAPSPIWPVTRYGGRESCGRWHRGRSMP
jgi:hypothetical protein